MKLQVINLQLTKNIGNYESVRVGGEWSVEEGDNIEQAFASARDELNAAFVSLMNKPTEAQKPTEKATEGKERLVFGTPKFQAVCDRILDRKVTSIEQIRQYFDFGEEEERVFELSFNL